MFDTRHHKQLDLFIPLNAETDVHTEHCCGEHGVCKYGDDDCSVVNRLKLPSWPCNCEWMW